MTWVDLAIVGVIFLSAVLAFSRGFSREVLGIGAWLGAGMLSAYAFDPVKRSIIGWFSSPDYVDVATFGLVFAVALVASLIAAKWLSSLIRTSALGGIDHSLGAVFGVARGAVLIIVSYIIAGIVVPLDRWPDPVLHARLLPFVYQGAVWTVTRLPRDYAPRVEQPPVGSPDPTADDLARTVPQGRATALARPGRTRVGETVK